MEEKKETVLKNEENEFDKALKLAKELLNDPKKVRINMAFTDLDENDEIDDEGVDKEDDGKTISDKMTLRLKMALDRVKVYYQDLRNYLAKFSNLSFRSNKSGDVYLVKNKVLFRVTVFSRALKVYFALNPKAVDPKYHTVNMKKVKKYEAIPVMLRVSSDRSFKYLLELVEMVAKKHKLKDSGKVYENDYVSLVQSNSQEILSLLGYDDLLVKSANKESSDVLPNNVAKNAQILVTNPNKDKVERVEYVVTVGELSAGFKDKYEVTLQLLKDVGMAPVEANYLKVAASGECRYPVHIIANDYDLQALKMIIITGGNVVKYVN